MEYRTDPDKFTPGRKLQVPDIPEKKSEKRRPPVDIAEQHSRCLLGIQIELFHHEDHVIGNIFPGFERESIGIMEDRPVEYDQVDAFPAKVDEDLLFIDPVLEIQPDRVDQDGGNVADP